MRFAFVVFAHVLCSVADSGSEVSDDGFDHYEAAKVLPNRSITRTTRIREALWPPTGGRLRSHLSRFISSCSTGRKSGFRPCRTNIEQRTGTTPRDGKGAHLLSVGLDQSMVFVKRFGRPTIRRHLHQPNFGLARIRTFVNEAEPLSHA
jgi:hypothetical protein